MVVVEKKAQFWLFTGVAFEVFVCLHVKNFRKAEAVKGTSDAGNGEALVQREQVGQGNQ